MSEQKKDFIMTPIHIVSCMVGILRQYFGTENRISVDRSKYIWKEDPRTSDLWIMEEFHDTRDVVGKRPLVLVGFPQASYPKDVMSDMLNYLPGGSEVRNICRTQGQIRFRCISDKALASIELATEIKYFIDIFRQQIQCSHGLDYLRSSTMQGPAKIEEYKEYFISNDEKWFQMFEKLKTFINENKRQPSTISK
jgi:hypothetical protein